MQEVVPGFGRPFGVYGYLSITSCLLENVAYFEDGSTSKVKQCQQPKCFI